MAAQAGAGLRRQLANERAFSVLETTGLAADANRRAGQLGLLDRKRLELARALATGPRLLLLDEVAAGLTDPEVDQLIAIVRRARGSPAGGDPVAVVWVEHVVRALSSTVDRLICLDEGVIIADGQPGAVLADPRVKEVYLGTEEPWVPDRYRSQRPDNSPATMHRAGAAARDPADRHRAMNPLLEVRDLTVRHGQLEAVRGVSLSVGAGEVLGIIGANGAGKSTLLRTIAGLHQPAAGAIFLDGVDITRLPPEKRVSAGLVLVPEGRRLFGSLNVEENLLAGCYRPGPGPWTMARVFAMFPWMATRRRQPASQLSGGEQQAVAISRALLANPRLLMLDEPSLGLAPLPLQRIYAVLPELVGSGLGVLLVEQDVRQAMKVSGPPPVPARGTPNTGRRARRAGFRTNRGGLLRYGEEQRDVKSDCETPVAAKGRAAK